jgi:hypothetical protein
MTSKPSGTATTGTAICATCANEGVAAGKAGGGENLSLQSAIRNKEPHRRGEISPLAGTDGFMISCQGMTCDGNENTSQHNDVSN